MYQGALDPQQAKTGFYQFC